MLMLTNPPENIKYEAEFPASTVFSQTKESGK